MPSNNNTQTIDVEEGKSPTPPTSERLSTTLGSSLAATADAQSGRAEFHMEAESSL